nr:YhgE/Pip domain-containing protein [Lachnospiraceae bacterium]
MKNIIKIFKQDIGSLRKNMIIFVVVIGITILPALYAWFNIASNWDPYSSTGNLPFAVCTVDEGYTYKDLKINAGEKIIDNLEKNDKMGWRFVDKKEAMEGVESGKYYACVIIPKDFSENLLSVTTGKFNQAQLEYYVNEKKNAISPKITDKGIEAIQTAVDEAYVSTIAETIATVLGVTESELEGSKDKIADKLVDSLGTVKTDVDSFNDTADLFIVTLKSVDDLIKDNKALIPEFKKDLSKAGVIMGDVNSMIHTTRDTASQFTSTLKSLVDSDKVFVDQMTDKVETYLGAVDSADLNKNVIIEHLEKIQDFNTNRMDKNSQIIEMLSSLGTDLGVKTLEYINKLEDNNEKHQEINDKIDDLISRVENTGKLPVDAKETLKKSVSDLKDLAKNDKEAIKGFLSALGKAIKENASIDDDISDELDEIFDKNANDANKIASKLDKLKKPFAKKKNAYSSLLAIFNNIEENFGIDCSKVINKVLKSMDKCQAVEDKIDDLCTEIRSTGEFPKDARASVEKVINNTKESFSKLKNEYDSTKEKLTTSLSKTRIDDISSTIDKIFGKIAYDAGTVADKLKDLKSIGEKRSEANDKLVDIFEKVESSSGVKCTKVINGLNEANESLQSLNDKIDSIREKINKTGEIPKDARENILSAVNNAGDKLYSVVSAYKDVKKDIDNVLDKSFDSLDNIASFAKTIDLDDSGVEKVLDSGSALTTNLIDIFKNLKKYFKDINTRIDKTIEHIEGIRDDDSLEGMLIPIIENPKALGEFISSPVTTNTHHLTPLANYGSAMAPFYTTLALWVGGIVLVAVINVDLTAEDRKKVANATSTQLFFGRYIIFFILGQIQAWIIALGDLFFLKIQCDNRVLFVLTCLLSSFVYTLFIYSMTITFSVIGKALSVIILVIQIAGAGGTFPIEVLPGPFKAVSPYLPFKYGIDAIRETVAGVDMSAYLNRIGIFALFII